MPLNNIFKDKEQVSDQTKASVTKNITYRFVDKTCLRTVNSH